jgi:hypothetical protein
MQRSAGLQQALCEGCIFRQLRACITTHRPSFCTKANKYGTTHTNAYTHNTMAHPVKKFRMTSMRYTTSTKMRTPNLRAEHNVSHAMHYHQRMCTRSKAWLAASVSLQLARLPPLQAGYGTRGCARPSRACFGHKTVRADHKKQRLVSHAMHYHQHSMISPHGMDQTRAQKDWHTQKHGTHASPEQAGRASPHGTR